MVIVSVGTVERLARTELRRGGSGHGGYAVAGGQEPFDEGRADVGACADDEGYAGGR